MKTLLQTCMVITVGVAGFLAYVFLSTNYPNPEDAKVAHFLGAIALCYAVGGFVLFGTLLVYLWIYGLFVRFTADQWYQGRDEHYDR